MKKIKPIILFSVISAMFCSLLVGHSFKGNTAIETEAAETDLAPRGGNAGSIMYVNGQSLYFNTNEADLAVYFYNDKGNAWTNKLTYRCFDDYLRVVLPSNNGLGVWTHCIVCRYNPNLDPHTDGFNGVYNQTENIAIGSWMYYQNTVNITGYSDQGKLNYFVNSNKYYGTRSGEHFYLDLSDFQGWEDGNAKFAVYFACPSSSDRDGWSQSYKGGYHSSFLWKAEGSDNSHLYEGVVPSSNSYGATIWNLIIAVRFSPDASEPSWEDKNIWNKTQNISFNSTNHNATTLKINSWNEGQLDTQNIISKEMRLNYYGAYFLNVVTCSGSGLIDSTTAQQWQSVKDQYVNMAESYQGDIWTTQANEEGTLIAQAMARYDYIVLFKKYSHEDFINREDSPNKTTFEGMVYFNYQENVAKNNSAFLMILIVSLAIPLVTIPVIIILKKKQHS